MSVHLGWSRFPLGEVLHCVHIPGSGHRESSMPPDNDKEDPLHTSPSASVAAFHFFSFSASQNMHSSAARARVPLLVASLQNPPCCDLLWSPLRGQPFPHDREMCGGDHSCSFLSHRACAQPRPARPQRPWGTLPTGRPGNVSSWITCMQILTLRLVSREPNPGALQGAL